MTYFALLEEEVRVGRFSFICTLESALTELLFKSVFSRVTSYVSKILCNIANLLKNGVMTKHVKGILFILKTLQFIKTA